MFKILEKICKYKKDKIKQGQNNLYEVFSFIDEKGKFDYEKYKHVQIEANKKKINNVWVQKENIEMLSKYILENIEKPTFGICHGTRRGMEQKWFKEYINCNVIGTEISDTATQFEDTIQWDFHDIKDEWIKNVDFIYSNSFDHTYNPEKCLTTWISCLKKNGICILEHTDDHQTAKETDPFGAKLIIMPYLILQWSKGKFFVADILDGIKNKENIRKRS